MNLKFNRAIRALGEKSFESAFLQEAIAQSNLLPLHKACHSGGVVKDGSVSISVLSVDEDQGFIKVKTQIFFDEVVGGCNCNDDPFEQVQMCEALFLLNEEDAQSEFVMLHD